MRKTIILVAVVSCLFSMLSVPAYADAYAYNTGGTVYGNSGKSGYGTILYTECGYVLSCDTEDGIFSVYLGTDKESACGMLKMVDEMSRDKLSEYTGAIPAYGSGISSVNVSEGNPVFLFDLGKATDAVMGFPES